MYEPGLVIRKPTRDDIPHLANLILRFYMFNEEFDPAMAVRENPEETAVKLAEEYIEEGSGVTLVAQHDDKVVGYVRVEIRDKPLLAAGKIGVITELYVMPQFRGRGVASSLVEEAGNAVTAMGINVITAEFPDLNFVAKNFYKKLGFRPYMDLYLREV